MSHVLDMLSSRVDISYVCETYLQRRVRLLKEDDQMHPVLYMKVKRLCVRTALQ